MVWSCIGTTVIFLGIRNTLFLSVANIRCRLEVTSMLNVQRCLLVGFLLYTSTVSAWCNLGYFLPYGQLCVNKQLSTNRSNYFFFFFNYERYTKTTASFNIVLFGLVTINMTTLEVVNNNTKMGHFENLIIVLFLNYFEFNSIRKLIFKIGVTSLFNGVSYL